MGAHIAQTNHLSSMQVGIIKDKRECVSGRLIHSQKAYDQVSQGAT